VVSSLIFVSPPYYVLNFIVFYIHFAFDVNISCCQGSADALMLFSKYDVTVQMLLSSCPVNCANIEF
jgi:hypothetical protein